MNSTSWLISIDNGRRAWFLTRFTPQIKCKTYWQLIHRFHPHQLNKIRRIVAIFLILTCIYVAIHTSSQVAMTDDRAKEKRRGKKNLCFLFSSRNVIDRNVHTHTNKSVNPKNYNNNKGEETEIHQSTKHTHARAQIQLVHRCELIHQSMKANYNVSKWKCPFSFPPCLSLYYCFFFNFSIFVFVWFK